MDEPAHGLPALPPRRLRNRAGQRAPTERDARGPGARRRPALPRADPAPAGVAGRRRLPGSRLGLPGRRARPWLIGAGAVAEHDEPRDRAAARRGITDQQITRRVGGGALAVVAGITLLLTVGSPRGGTSAPPAAAWWSACLSSAVLIGALCALGCQRSRAAKALVFGSAAGVAFGLQTAVMKSSSRWSATASPGCSRAGRPTC